AEQFKALVAKRKAERAAKNVQPPKAEALLPEGKTESPSEAAEPEAPKAVPQVGGEAAAEGRALGLSEARISAVHKHHVEIYMRGAARFYKQFDALREAAQQGHKASTIAKLKEVRMMLHSNASKERKLFREETGIDLPKTSEGIYKALKAWMLGIPAKEEAAKPTTGEYREKTLKKFSDPEDQAVFRSVHMVSEAEERWGRLREKGATDAEIREQIGKEFGEFIGASGEPGFEATGGKDPKLYFGGRYEAKQAGRKPLSGKPLIDRVRRLLEIPQPAPAANAPSTKEPWQMSAAEFGS